MYDRSPEFVDPRVEVMNQSPSDQNFSTVAADYAEEEEASRKVRIALLTVMPDPGYFVAGGLAGVISRTATAPLDRLKVYLIAQTGVRKDSIEAAKQGNVTEAAKKLRQPLIDACKDLWKAGGMRSLFAGEFIDFPQFCSETHARIRQWTQCGQSHAGICNQVWLV